MRIRPVFSLLGMAGGVLSGIGVLVLLQQAGLVYPTRTVAILAVVLGFLWGIALPSLKGARRWRKVERRIDALAARLR
jgi:hypothetical protein